MFLESSEPQNKVKTVRDRCSEFERTRTLLNPDSDSKHPTLLARLLPLWHRENPRVPHSLFLLRLSMTKTARTKAKPQSVSFQAIRKPCTQFWVMASTKSPHWAVWRIDPSIKKKEENSGGWRGGSTVNGELFLCAVPSS